MSNSGTALAEAPPAVSDTHTGMRGRRPQGNARRQLLLQTTLRLIADQGIDAVSHRAVAEAAAVPLGSTTYWFASRQDMLREAFEQFARSEIESARARLEEMLGNRLSRRSLVDAFTAHLLSELEERRWRTVAQYALVQEATRQPELERVCRDWTEAWEEMMSEIFAKFAAREPELEARSFLALLDGLLVGQLAAPSEDLENEVLRPTLEAWFARVPREES